jgi:hypothetical protein
VLSEQPGGRRHGSRLIDISLKGALVELPSDWRPATGQRVGLEIRLLDSPITIRMDSEVAHVEGERLGLHCLSIDLESMTHLRRLMELNLGDSRLLERELLSLG